MSWEGDGKVTWEDVKDKATSMLGIKEQPLGSNNVPGITDWYGIKGPWCAMGLSKLFDSVGMPIPATTDKGFAYVPSGVNFFKEHDRWAGPDATPNPGWVVFFKFTTRPDHVGLVMEVNARRDLETWECNTDGAGSRTGGQCMLKHRTGGIFGYGIMNYAVPVPALVLPNLDADRGVVQHPSGKGGWAFEATGDVFTFGGAAYYGGANALPRGAKLAAPITSMVATPTGKGYWQLGADGGVFAFGDATGIKPYSKLFAEYADGERRIIGAVWTGQKSKPETWGLTLISNKLEEYALK